MPVRQNPARKKSSISGSNVKFRTPLFTSLLFFYSSDHRERFEHPVKRENPSPPIYFILRVANNDQPTRNKHERVPRTRTTMVDPLPPVVK